MRIDRHGWSIELKMLDKNSFETWVKLVHPELGKDYDSEDRALALDYVKNMLRETIEESICAYASIYNSLEQGELNDKKG